jgi:hypothetical protein
MVKERRHMKVMILKGKKKALISESFNIVMVQSAIARGPKRGNISLYSHLLMMHGQI